MRLFCEEGISYSVDTGTPDIETISDLIYKYKISWGSNQIDELGRTLRMGIVKELINVKNPNLDYHVRFLKALKKLMSGRAESIWIFTTNYDLLFELSAMRAEIPIFNGFEGIWGDISILNG
jgi:hypothetical protein